VARALAAGGLAAALLAPSGASASPTFPGVVDTYIGMPSQAQTICPPDGCHLCHVNETGNLPNVRFGNLVASYGAQQEMPNSLVAALAAVEANDPQYIADLKAGTNPNDDTTMAAATNIDPQPVYGCGSISASRTAPGGVGVTLVGVLVALRMRRRRRLARVARAR
jgi:hypothetical protein